jgi:hypothetical protein
MALSRSTFAIEAVGAAVLSHDVNAVAASQALQGAP